VLQRTVATDDDRPAQLSDNHNVRICGMSTVAVAEPKHVARAANSSGEVRNGRPITN